MRICAHPDNIDALRKALPNGIPEVFGMSFHPYESFELISNPFLEKDRPNGKYRIGDGAEMQKDQFSMKTRFVEYGPEDIDWLVLAGVVTECREMNYYVMHDSMFRLHHDITPMVFEPRFLIKNVS